MTKVPIRDSGGSSIPSDKGIHRDSDEALLNAYDIGVDRRSDIEIDEDSVVTVKRRNGIVELGTLTINNMETTNTRLAIRGQWHVKDTDETEGIIVSSRSHVLVLDANTVDDVSHLIFELYSSRKLYGKIRIDSLDATVTRDRSFGTNPGSETERKVHISSHTGSDTEFTYLISAKEKGYVFAPNDLIVCKAVLANL